MDLSALNIRISDDALYRTWLIDCYRHSESSIHPSTHNAALIIEQEKVICRGVNNLPPGVLQKEERFTGENKHVYPNHAERDALYRAARLGIKTEGLTMVMPWLPCIPCTNAIISSGIAFLIVHRQMVERTKERWREELKNGVEIMREAAVEIVAYDGLLGVKAYMHGLKWDA